MLRHALGERTWHRNGQPPLTQIRKDGAWRGVIETGFIMFLFYSNLLMGEFTRANAPGKILLFALSDILMAPNFAIGAASASIGYMVVEFLRRRTIAIEFALACALIAAAPLLVAAL